MMGGFLATFRAVLQILIIAVAAGVLVRRGIITQAQIKSASSLTVTILLPCLIFTNIVQHFEPAQLSLWYLIPLASVVMTLAGTGIAALLFVRELPGKKNMLPMASMQNAGYLVLPLGKFLYPDRFDAFALYCFLFVLGISPILWSLGKFLSTSTQRADITWRDFATPPFFANAAAILLVLTGTRRFLPGPLLESARLIGTATIPLALLVLGAALGSISFTVRPPAWDTIRVVGVKMVVIPLAVIAALSATGIRESFPMLANLFVIQSASAPATAIMLQVRHYGGDVQKVGSIMLVSYLACILALPFWLAVWQALGG